MREHRRDVQYLRWQVRCVHDAARNPGRGSFQIVILPRTSPAGTRTVPDFADAVRRREVIAAIETSAASRERVKV